MARQILPLVDLRTPEERQGLSRTQQTLQSIAGILRTAGEIQKKNRERQTLDRVQRAIAGGATTVEAIAGAAREPEQAGGFRGGLQSIVGAFEPQGGGVGEGIQQSIISQTLRQALAPKPLLTPEEQRESALVKGGLKARPRAVTLIKPTELFEQTKAQKERDRAIEVLTKKDKDGELIATDAQIKDAQDQVRQNPALREVTPGGLDKAFAKLVKKEQIKKLKIKRKGDILDKRFGKAAYDASLRKALIIGLGNGATESSVEREFNRWWDEQAKEENVFGFGEFIPRSEFQETTQGAAADPSLDLKLQTAPDARLDEFWPNLPDEEKKEIIQRLDEDPKNIDSILKILQAG